VRRRENDPVTGSCAITTGWRRRVSQESGNPFLGGLPCQQLHKRVKLFDVTTRSLAAAPGEGNPTRDDVGRRREYSATHGGDFRGSTRQRLRADPGIRDLTPLRPESAPGQTKLIFRPQN
jgi:hypothetical protein